MSHSATSWQQEVAASLVLVLGTGLMARSLGALQTVETGVDADRLAYLALDWSRAGLAPEEAATNLAELRERIEALPGVERAAFGSRIPALRQGTTTTEVEGYVPPAGTNAVEMPFANVTDEYFETMGIPLAAGRTFGPDDAPGGPGVSIVVSEATARRLWGDADPIGRRMRGQGAETWTRTVVGVIGNTPVAAIGEGPTPMMYFSARQRAATPSYLIARTDGDPSSILEPMRREVAAWRSSVTVNAQGTLASHFGASLATPRMAARAMGAFAVLALLLAGLGIYTVVTFSVAKRSSELGIRIALGAERSGVVRMVVREVAGIVGVGVGVGVVVSALAASRFDGMLYGVDALDPPTFAGAVVVLLAVAWLAAYLPARRAALADPVKALRAS